MEVVVENGKLKMVEEIFNSEIEEGFSVRFLILL